MKKIVLAGVILGLVGVVAFRAMNSAGAGPVNEQRIAEIFTHTTLASAKAEAAKKTPAGLIVADFTAEWCPPCKMMKADSWSDAGVADWMKANAIGALIDVDRRAEDASSAKIEAMPTVVVYRGEREVARNLGYMDAKQLLAFLKAAQAK